MLYSNRNIVNRRIYIPELNILRFFFMLMIFFHHLDNCTLFPQGGYLAVTFFFVLSGFSMTIGYKGRVMEPNFSYYQFVAKRLTKFFPIHWLFFFGVLFLMILERSSDLSDNLLVPEILSNFFLIQSFFPIKDVYFSFNGPSWYLCNTLFYCVLFPFILKVLCHVSILFKYIILLFIVCLYIVLVVFVPKEMYHAILYVNPFVRLLDFTLGIFAGLFFLESYERNIDTLRSKTDIWWKVVAILCLVIILFFSLNRLNQEYYSVFVHFYWIIYCPLLFSISFLSVQGKSKLRNGRWGILQRAGSYSFTFYMIHYFCILSLNVIYRRIEIGLCSQILVTFTITMALSWLLQRYYVEPCGKLLMNKISK